MNLGGRVKQQRNLRDWGQQQLADKVGGLSQQALGLLESRDSKTSEFAVGLADALNVSLRWLLTGAGRADDPDWPFDRVDRSRWDDCNDVDRGYLQSAMNRALDECEAERAKRTQATTAQASAQVSLPPKAA